MIHQQSSSRDNRQERKRICPVTFIVTLSLNVVFFLFATCHAQPQPKTLANIKLSPKIHDTGIFSDLDVQAKVPIPSWLPKSLLKIYRWASHGEEVLGLFYHQHLIKLFSLNQGALQRTDQNLLLALYPTLILDQIDELPQHFRANHDRDQDGILDTLDLHLGAIKTVLNGAEYQEGYERLKYPLGDVSRKIGVCTDVVIRTLRNAGWDLQKLIYLDMLAHPKLYHLNGKRPNRHIDHRRVRRQVIYFRKHYKSLPISFDLKQTGDDAWLPGDILFMDTLSKGRPTHVGIVSGTIGSDGMPQIINNWTYGYQTNEMSLKNIAVYTHRFRITLPKKSHKP